MEMLNAKELRQGNLVLDPYGNEREVTGVRGDKVYLSRAANIDAIYPASELSPIPLTAEWLERAGFHTVTTNEDGSNNYWSKSLDASIDYEYEGIFRYRIFEKQRTKSIISLHQLQNLYFALTGSELEIAGR